MIKVGNCKITTLLLWYANVVLKGSLEQKHGDAGGPANTC
jgi:hypothetical protein